MTRLPARQTAVALERLREAIRPGGLDDRPDADLLERFARYADHPAFEVLLRRHGPMVLGVCRRVLANPADAEDAFQATFLVLVRKARSVRRGDRLGPWLYGVACRVAAKARARSARVAVRTEATDMIPDPDPQPEVPDWLPVLDAELNALPAKYREPLVLCELQGATRADAAKALGIPEGTLSSRLSRGRELLRRRLLKHGTLLPAGGLAALFAAHGVGRAAVPTGLFAKTAELAALVATGAATAGVVPVGPARLTDEVLKSMFLTKLRVTGGAILALGLVAAGLLAALPNDAPAQAEKPRPATKDAKPQPAKPAAAGPKVPDRDALQGLWVLDKCDHGKGIRTEEIRENKEQVGKMQFLVAGDVWWGMIGGPRESVFPQVAKLDAGKNPKWLDLRAVTSHGFDLSKCIYELDGDRLSVCVTNGGSEVRPAEFSTDDDTPLMVMHFRREKLPPAAGEPALVGSWVGIPTVTKTPDGVEKAHTPRVEILDGYLFAFDNEGKVAEWIGGKYTVDATKNPKWIDVELSGPIDHKVKKLYGSYEVVDGRLKLALGTNGKRAVRPLELKSGPDVWFFDLKPTKEPLAAMERVVVREPLPTPAPQPEDRLRPNP